MASQSFFLANLQVLNYPQGSNDGTAWLYIDTTGLYVDSGFSPIAIVFTLIVGGTAFVVVAAMGLRRYSRC